MLGAALSVTAVAMLGGVGVLPSVASGSDSPSRAIDPAGARSTAAASSSASSPVAAPSDVAVQPAPAADQSSTAPSATPSPDPPAQQPAQQPAQPPVPEDSGDGRRVVFSQGQQRVWLVEEDETVVRTYLVSGSVYDNLDPGTYEVYSRSEQAYGIDGSGSMNYFVRFTEGDNGGAIGFHDIPVDDGGLVQSVDELGTPLSHGCVRQDRPDAIALWEFAPVGTEVDVVA